MSFTSTLAVRFDRVLLARALALGLALPMMGVVLASIWLQYGALQRPCPESVAFCAGLTTGNLQGLPSPERALAFFATFRTIQDLAVRGVFWTVALLLLWQRPTQPVAVLAAFLFLATGNTGALFVAAATFPPLTVFTWLVLFLIYGGLALLFCLFPNGHFVPAWSRWPAAAWCIMLVIDRLLPTSLLARLPAWFPGPVLAFFFSFQLYRYWRRTTPRERKQTRWAVLGFLIFLGGFAGIALLGWTFPRDRPLTGVDYLALACHSLFASAIPVTMGIAILRENLFDIDLLINRTLVYGLLTAGVVGVYAALVAGLGALLQSQDSLLVSLLVTGLVAVLFQPLRDRLQRAVNRLMYGERDDPYAVLSRFGQRLEGSLAPDSVLPTIVETITQTLKLPYASIRLGGATRVAHGVLPPDTQPESFPLVYQGEAIGEVDVAPRAAGEPFTAMERRLLVDIAHQAGVAAHAARLAADLQHARERLVSAREEERRRLRRDLHDGLGPKLAGQALILEAVRDGLEPEAKSSRALITHLIEDSQTIVSEVRQLVQGLRPMALDELGLVAAVRAQAAQCELGGLRVTVSAPDALRSLPAAVEVAAYRIIQEALTNVVRHAHAGECEVRVTLGDSALHIEVQDDGVGLPPGRRVGVGLASMRERAEEIGGWCILEAGDAARGGTRVAASLPLARSP